MGNFIDFVRPPSTKIPRNHEFDLNDSRNNVNSPRISKSSASVVLPFVVQQSFLQPSDLSSSNLNPISIRTPSSSGVSSSSSATTSPIMPKSINDRYNFQYVAIFDYDARTKDDLTIRKSDLLEIINRKSSAWWKAKNENGQEGWIPSNYVAKRDSLESEP